MEAKKVKPEPVSSWEPPPLVQVEPPKDVAEDKPLIPPLAQNPEKPKEKIVEGSVDIDAELAWLSEQRLCLIKAWEESEKSKAQNNSQLILGNSFQDVQRTHTNPQKGARSINMWRAKEDVALMSAWCFIMEELGCGNNQKKLVLWRRVSDLYEETRKENPTEIGVRNLDSLKGRKRRLDENAKKWIVAYKEAYNRRTGGMSMEDIEKEAHAIYHEKSGSKFCDLRVFKEVMSKHPKWELKLDWDSKFSRRESNEESRGSSKRSRNVEHWEFSVPSNPETLAKDSSSIPRGDAAKRKGKGVATRSSVVSDDFTAELRALRFTREKEWNDRIELERLKLEMSSQKMNMTLLNTLVAKVCLSPREIEVKDHLMALLFPK